MGVTTVRDRLAAALREHAGFHNDYDREVGWYHQCQCGASGSGNTTLVEHMGHLADVLLAGPVGELLAEVERLKAEQGDRDEALEIVRGALKRLRGGGVQ